MFSLQHFRGRWPGPERRPLEGEGEFLQHGIEAVNRCNYVKVTKREDVVNLLHTESRWLCHYEIGGSQVGAIFQSCRRLPASAPCAGNNEADNRGNTPAIGEWSDLEISPGRGGDPTINPHRVDDRRA
jgi:hypothetical protein